VVVAAVTVRADALPIASSSPARGLVTAAEDVGAQGLVVEAATISPASARACSTARLRPISVIDPVAWTAELWPDLITPDRIARYRDGEQRHLQAAADETCGGGALQVEVLEGRVEALEEATGDLDLVICGSRGYGPARPTLILAVALDLGAAHARGRS
jgi:hypothetical protein